MLPSQIGESSCKIAAIFPLWFLGDGPFCFSVTFAEKYKILVFLYRYSNLRTGRPQKPLHAMDGVSTAFA